MIAIYETAYPRIKPHLSHKELREVFTPTEVELALLNTKTKKTLPISRLGFMVLLKCYQYLGRPVKLCAVDGSIIRHIAGKLGIDPTSNLSLYNKKTRKRHITFSFKLIKQDWLKVLVKQFILSVCINKSCHTVGQLVSTISCFSIFINSLLVLRNMCG